MYHPIQPPEGSIEWMKEMVKKNEGRELTDREAFEASYNFLNFFNMLLYLDDKQKRAMKFQYTEDGEFFALLLTNGDNDEFRAQHIFKFDFREPSIKRADFDKLKKSTMEEFAELGRTKCELRLVSDCDSQSLSLDHIIPLSSNELNKHLRKMTAPQGKKVPAQSYGSNDPRNFLVACEKCNGFKKHRFIKKEGSEWGIYRFR